MYGYRLLPQYAVRGIGRRGYVDRRLCIRVRSTTNGILGILQSDSVPSNPTSISTQYGKRLVDRETRILTFDVILLTRQLDSALDVLVHDTSPYSLIYLERTPKKKFSDNGHTNNRLANRPELSVRTWRISASSLQSKNCPTCSPEIVNRLRQIEHRESERTFAVRADSDCDSEGSTAPA